MKVNSIIITIFHWNVHIYIFFKSNIAVFNVYVNIYNLKYFSLNLRILLEFAPNESKRCWSWPTAPEMWAENREESILQIPQDCSCCDNTYVAYLMRDSIYWVAAYDTVCIVSPLMVLQIEILLHYCEQLAIIL